MRKINLAFLLVFMVSLVAGCSSDDSDDYTTSYVQVKMNYDSSDKGPEGTVFLFDITNDKVKSNDVYFTYLENNYLSAYMRDVNNEFVFPVYKSSLFRPSKDNDGYYINKSFKSIYWYELPSYFENIKSHKFLLVVSLKYNHYTSKVIEWGNKTNLVFEKTFTKEYDDGFEEW